MKTRLRIRSIVAFRLFLALAVLASLGFVIGMLILLRWGPSKAGSQEALTIRDILAGKDILLGWKPGLEELAELGCSIIVEPTYVHCVQPDRSIPIIVRFPTIRALNFVRQTLGHELGELPKLPELERLSFISCEFVDSLAFLGNLHSLRYLSITGTTLTNQHFDELRLLSNMNSLTELDLSTTNVSSLEFLASMSDLEVLRLVATRITDDDMQLIATLEKLRVLEVGWTEITDASVDVLREVKGLQELNIRGTRVTEDGLRQLESSISHVFHDDFSSQ